MRVFFIQKLRGASLGKINNIPSSAGISSLNINPRACFSRVSAISTAKLLPPNSTLGPPEAQAVQVTNISTHNKIRIWITRLLSQPNDSKQTVESYKKGAKPSIEAVTFRLAQFGGSWMFLPRPYKTWMFWMSVQGSIHSVSWEEHPTPAESPIES